MKKSIKFLGMLLFAAFIFGLGACGEDDDVTGKIDDIVNKGTTLDPGYYVIGSAVSADSSAANRLVAAKVSAPDFGSQERAGLYEGYVYMSSGSYSFIKVIDSETVEAYGGTADMTYTKPSADAADSIVAYIGDFALDGGEATSAVDGLAHVLFDETSGQFIVAPVEYWEVIGGATETGWSSGQKLDVKSASADEVVFEGTNITLRPGEMKFRYNSNWNSNLEPDCDEAASACLNYFTNFGGTTDVPVHGGGNIDFAGEDGAYTITLTFSPAAGYGVAIELTKTGDVEPLPEYPTELYMVGGSVGGWDWAANGIDMIPVHSNAHLFWRIVWLDAAVNDEGFKFAPQKDWIGDFGKTGDATDGVYGKGSDNVPCPTTAGYYTVVVNLDKETVEVNPAMVYGIGDAFGGWDAATEAYKFTENATDMTLVSPAFVADADLRIHVAASTLTKFESTDAVDWWQAEFVVLDGNIEYRGTGDDQARNVTTTGQTVALDFVNGTGTFQ
jgi:hypothetical protein